MYYCVVVSLGKNLLEIHRAFELEETKSLAFKFFFEKNGPTLLLDALEKFEVSSRISGNHLSLIGIIKIFDMLTFEEKSKTFFAPNI